MVFFWKELGCCIAKLEKIGHKFVPRDLEGRHLGTSKGGTPGTSSEERGGGGVDLVGNLTPKVKKQILCF